MQAPLYPAFRAILSPCVGTCRLDDAGLLCLGCRRSAAEIAAWTLMDDAARLRVIERLALQDTGSDG